MTASSLIWLRVILISFCLLIIALITSIWWPLGAGDTDVYQHYSEMIWNGLLPYKDFGIEYPPGVLPFIVLAHPIGLLFGSYAVGFMAIATAILSFLLWHLYKLGGQKAMFLLIGLILPLLQFVYFQLEIFAGIALYGSIYLLSRKRFQYSAILLAIATLIKAYPLVCLPALLFAVPAHKRRLYLLVVVAVLALGILPFLLLSPGGLWSSLTYHSGRPLQLESGPAAIGFIADVFGNTASVIHSHASLALVFPGADFLNVLSSFLLIGGLVIGSVFLWRKRPKPALGSLFMLLIFLIFFKVGSPQFLIPLILISILAIRELPADMRRTLLLRVAMISLVVFMTYLEFYSNFFYLIGVMIVLKVILLLELLIWTVRRINSRSSIQKTYNSF